MENQNTDRVTSRIAKMLALAADKGTTEGERDNALRMAYATMAKYNIDIASVTATTKKPAPGEAREQQMDTFLGYPWARQVAMAAAELFFCSYYYTKVRGSGQAHHNFIGRTSNAVTAREMAKYLVASIHNEARAYQRATYPHLQTQYTSFAMGAMYKVYARCQALRAEAEAPKPAASTGMSLAVIYKSEAVENDKFLATTGVKLRTKTSKVVLRDENARRAGAVYGSGISLDRQLS
jgi:hypothetical protein